MTDSRIQAHNKNSLSHSNSIMGSIVVEVVIIIYVRRQDDQSLSLRGRYGEHGMGVVT